jgi:hypothetical protein
LPANFLVSKSKKKYCAIEYTLSVRAIPLGQKPLVGLGKISVTINAAPVPNEIVPATITPDALQVESDGAAYSHSMGTLGAAARVVDVHVGRGHRLEIFLACINDAEVKIDKVRMALVQRAYWNTAEVNQRKIITELELVTIDNVHLPGVERKPTEARSSKEALLHLLELPANKIHMDVPYGCLDSYSTGKVVNIRHFVKVTFKTRTGVTDPFFLIPITVAREQLESSYPRTQDSDEPQSAFPGPLADSQNEGPIGDWSPHFDYENRPVVLADVVIPPDAFIAETASIRLDATIFGGMAVEASDETNFPAMAEAFAVSNISDEPSMEVLLRELEESIHDYNLLLSKLNDPSWSELIARISPMEYSYILVLVNEEADQPRVAHLLAQHIALYGRFTCEHAKAAFLNVANWTRTNTVE